jgi:hypothetical protein
VPFPSFSFVMNFITAYATSLSAGRTPSNIEASLNSSPGCGALYAKISKLGPVVNTKDPKNAGQFYGIRP